MKSTIFYCFFILLCFSYESIAQPYSGTIFIESNIINAVDPSTYKSSTYKGQGSRVVYDRRTASWVTINAYLFEVIWSDGLKTEAQINPEFGSVALATIEAEKYGRLLGQLPNCLRTDIDAIWIHQGVQPFGGGNRSVLIHTGQSSLYEAQGILEETLVHEASHTSLDAKHSGSTGWVSAQNKDPNFISTYARDNPTREDIAESFLLWMAVRHRASRISTANLNTIKLTIPNRLAYFDSQAFNMFPTASGTSSIEQDENLLTDKKFKMVCFPNPFSKDITINFETTKREIISVEIYTSAGQKISTILNEVDLAPGKHSYHWNRENNSSELISGGTYFITIRSIDGASFVQKVQFMRQ